MNSEIKYIELKTGYSDDGPAWIGRVDFSKSGKTMYFNGQAFKGSGHGSCNDLESGDEYWISGVKRNGQDRHYAGGGIIMIDSEIVDEYLKIVDFNILDKKYFEPVDILPTDKKKFAEIENETYTPDEFNSELRHKNPNELTDEELKFIIDSLGEDEINAKFNKGRRSYKRARLEFEEELESRKTSYNKT
ncbi:hypothetical protein [Algoriphagus aquimarinus]|uniref:hypothetical protein n=1 Tax=Algoriphagus aquimarinus TaxID=237018 RepID=UPI0030D6DECE|tara:strand:+ start:182 stop:751 length:570 start_codon:yes stop_codon:yes gene_type:complete